jgi:hypothetical protein
MITFKDLLAERTVRELSALARAYALPLDNQKPRRHLLSRLYEDFSRHECFRRALKTLSAEERSAINVFVRHGGCLKSVEFFQRYGDIRPYRPWRTRTTPWKNPISIAESLWVKGFIQPQRGGVHLCAEVATLLARKEQLSQPASAGLTNPSQAALAPGAALLHDLLIWLGMMMGSSPRVRHGRWLPLVWLRAASARLRLPDSRLLHARSELQCDRLRFLHYLAEAAGWLTTVQGRLFITERAWHWLNLVPPAQLALLRRAVGQDLEQREPLWERYRLPARGTHARRQLLAQLKGMPPAITPAMLHIAAGELRLSLPPLPPARAYAQLSAWAGFDAEGLIIGAESARASGLSLAQIADQIARFTGEPLPRPAFDQIHRWLTDVPDLRLESAALLTASSPASLDRLTADRRLRPHLGARLTPHHLVVRPESTAILHRRLTTRGLLSPTAYRNPPSPKIGDQSPSPRRTRRLGEGFGVRADETTYLALRLAQELTRATALPLHIPGALSDAYRESLADDDIFALETRVRTLVEATRAALSERPQVDVPLAPAQDDPDAIRAAVKRAFAQRQPLHIEYYSPWQGTITQRYITPLVEIRWEGDVGYIEAWCGLDHAERTFRLDRILRLLP